MPNETKCPECGMGKCMSGIFKCESTWVDNHLIQSDTCKTIQALKKENEAKKSTIRNVFSDLECGYDNGMIQSKMENKCYSTDKWGNPTTGES